MDSGISSQSTRVQFGLCFLDYSVAARGTPHQTDPLPGKPPGDLPFSELLGMTHKHIKTQTRVCVCCKAPVTPGTKIALILLKLTN